MSLEFGETYSQVGKIHGHFADYFLMCGLNIVGGVKKEWGFVWGNCELVFQSGSERNAVEGRNG